ncbi:cysteine proteinase [Ascodesmis nigricans]|uniref:ubiquitinyl hydrolase 1 n=1 Tax=Ascodesmis nigricans TaxID=341454 RepID=A0A4S2N783_9PEZI|nr:cysteine proteinase [Ascodesmis nigricans]
MFNMKIPWNRGGDKSDAQSKPTPAKKVEGRVLGLQSLVGDGPPRPDGSDRFFGMENLVGIRNEPPYGNTCYCNSILQCLYYSKPFRENVVNYPMRGQPSFSGFAADDETSNDSGVPGKPIVRINTEPLPTTSASALAAAKVRSPVLGPTLKDEGKKTKQLPPAALLHTIPTPQENPNSADCKKKKALESGPILEVDQGNHGAYGMDESLFTALKDLFESIMAHHSKTGVVKPNKFLEVLRRENEMFNGQQHQDAHEFLNLLLNSIIDDVEKHEKNDRKNRLTLTNGVSLSAQISGSATPASTASTASFTAPSSVSVAGWMDEIFRGSMTSETKCLTCENISRRDEQFLDLSIDLAKNSSVTSCLRAFSASEMLCEKNKFHCDTCGGLQEAEKRMKIKRLPKVLALHLKRFKYMEDTMRFEKLHYRVVYPYHLRLFNTTDDANDPDKIYELYAVVVHIGGGPYFGHYVAIVKTEDKGWLLFDDELVEPVSKDYVRNFFGDGTPTAPATAYLLFYQETTLEAIQQELWKDETASSSPSSAPVDGDSANIKKDSTLYPHDSTLSSFYPPSTTTIHSDITLLPNGSTVHSTITSTSTSTPQLLPTSPLLDQPDNLYHTRSSPFPPVHPPIPPAVVAAEHTPTVSQLVKSKKEKTKEKPHDLPVNGVTNHHNHVHAHHTSSSTSSTIHRFRNTSKSLRRLGGSMSLSNLAGRSDKDKYHNHASSSTTPSIATSASTASTSTTTTTTGDHRNSVAAIVEDAFTPLSPIPKPKSRWCGGGGGSRRRGSAPASATTEG